MALLPSTEPEAGKKTELSELSTLAGWAFGSCHIFLSLMFSVCSEQEMAFDFSAQMYCELSFLGVMERGNGEGQCYATCDTCLT